VWAGSWLLGALAIALTVWLVYFVIEVARRLEVWPF
jgi:hypothetical protein